MSLIPIPKESLESILTLGLPTAEQYGTYWGRTSKEQYSALLETLIVTFLGLFLSYFLSFVIGTPLATLTGAISFFWIIIGPELKAYQRNLDLIGGLDLTDPWIIDDDYYEDNEYMNNNALFGAYFISSVENVAVVENEFTSTEYSLDKFDSYTMEEDDQESIYGTPWKLRLRIQDRTERSLQVHARMSEEYLEIEKGMIVVTVLLSTSSDFLDLDALTDFYILEADAWVGDYPYLNKNEVRQQIFTNKAFKRILNNEKSSYCERVNDKNYEVMPENIE